LSQLKKIYIFSEKFTQLTKWLAITAWR